MEKQIINITDIITYLYCPRKLYLKKVRGIKEMPTKKMISGLLKHKIFDIFNKNEKLIVYSIKEKIKKQEIVELYKDYIRDITRQVIQLNSEKLKKFDINIEDFFDSIIKFTDKEISLRTSAILKTLEKGFYGTNLWENLKPKFFTELQIISENLGLKGRIDRIEVGDDIVPYEIKTRKDIFISDKIQLAGYALLLEDKFNQQVNKGFVETADKIQEVFLTKDLKNQVLEIAEKIREMIREEKEVPITNNFKKCENCKFKKTCFNESQNR